MGLDSVRLVSDAEKANRDVVLTKDTVVFEVFGCFARMITVGRQREGKAEAASRNLKDHSVVAFEKVQSALGHSRPCMFPMGFAVATALTLLLSHA